MVYIYYICPAFSSNKWTFINHPTHTICASHHCKERCCFPQCNVLFWFFLTTHGKTYYMVAMFASLSPEMNWITYFLLIPIIICNNFIPIVTSGLYPYIFLLLLVVRSYLVHMFASTGIYSADVLLDDMYFPQWRVLCVVLLCKCPLFTQNHLTTCYASRHYAIYIKLGGLSQRRGLVSAT